MVRNRLMAIIRGLLGSGSRHAEITSDHDRREQIRERQELERRLAILEMKAEGRRH